ncbi:hypothetical protein ACS60R_09060 [Streptococcus suis]|uniref:hypothetical protein n=1 Tax=Streptococcus suis TaxID=1307 RepID=UPI001E5C8F15|nr:hypothetical protein [Streptococcus suis]MCB2860549.1 hypothetical protein [Streptococcus suis]MCO8218541.1 hypothetical protein [Streptococcus suis]HEM3479100.1 hypothetical protein [Streptococcus suis]HEM3505695.1 hypothetical protein [Streptococcus suis]HEM4764177.1 hypothetical protein [Streptococcus suis]
MKFQFNKHFYRYNAFYSMIFWICFLLPDILLDPSQTPAWYSLFVILILFIHAIRTFFLKEEKELTRMGYIFHFGMIVLIVYLKFILGK